VHLIHCQSTLSCSQTIPSQTCRHHRQDTISRPSIKNAGCWTKHPQVRLYRNARSAVAKPSKVRPLPSCCVTQKTRAVHNHILPWLTKLVIWLTTTIHHQHPWGALQCRLYSVVMPQVLHRRTMYGPSRTAMAGKVERPDLYRNDPRPICPSRQISQADSQGSIQRTRIYLFGRYCSDMEFATLFEQPQMEGRRRAKSA
jgi:hypothetical protein